MNHGSGVCMIPVADVLLDNADHDSCSPVSYKFDVGEIAEYLSYRASVARKDMAVVSAVRNVKC